MRCVLLTMSALASLVLVACETKDDTGQGQTTTPTETDTSSGDVSPPCSPIDCNDDIDCTRDYCVQGTCVNAADDTLCEGDAVCRPTTGCYTPPPTPRCSGVDDPVCDDGQACTTDACDTATGKCTYTTSDAACADGKACNGDERCTPFVGCVAGQPPSCNDNVDCTVDSCDDATGCAHAPNDQLCQDGVFCDGVEICHLELGCRENPETPDCDDGIACTIDRCELPGRDICTHTADQSACGAGTICRPDLGCFELPQCRVANDPACDDGQACTADSCDVETGRCRNIPNHGTCDNGQYCDGVEQCAPFVGCVSGTVVACNDNVACTIDLCDEANDRCGVVLNHLACGDGVYCDGDEQCTATGCVEGAQRNCDDGIACTVDACEGSGCVHRTDDTLCGFGAFCDPTSGGGCTETARCTRVDDPICDDGQACTTDSCDIASGKCKYDVNDAMCNDGQFCNGREVCAPFRGCLFASFPACDDGVACTIDTCNEANDTCGHAAEDRLCSNLQFCDGNEICHPQNGCGPGVAPTCDDGLGCTVDSCNPATNGCMHFGNDADGDGELDKACGGTDCNNLDPAINSLGTETCDFIDNDCDGDTDEGLRSTCDDCDPTCNASTPGGDPDDPNGGFEPTGFVSVEFSNEAGGLIIQTVTTLTVNHLWIPNTNESTLSKWDATTATEIGRYRVGLADGECPSRCCWEAPCNQPSRVVVDGRGDAYIANRGFGMQGTVTKIISDLDRCVDRNSNGTIETSTTNVPLGWDEDECVAYTANVGPINAVLRAIAIDRGDASHPEGYPWVGGYESYKFWKLDPSTGVTLAEVDVPVRPYGAVVLASDKLWIGTLDQNGIASIDTKTNAVSAKIDYPAFRGCGNSYGITADRKGRLWMAGWDCGDVLGYDTDANTWTRLDLSSWGMGYIGRGITIDRDGEIWVALNAEGQSYLGHFDTELFSAGQTQTPPGGPIQLPSGITGPSGVGVDAEGYVWVAHYHTSQLVRYNPTSGEQTVHTGPNRTYTYSDFTGAVRRTVIARGSYVHDVDAGCADPDWTAFTWDGTVPTGASLEFVLKSANLLSGVQAAPEVSMGMDNPADIDAKYTAAGATPGRHTRVIVNLTGNEDGASPVLRSFRIDWHCPAPD